MGRRSTGKKTKVMRLEVSLARTLESAIADYSTEEIVKAISTLKETNDIDFCNRIQDEGASAVDASVLEFCNKNQIKECFLSQLPEDFFYPVELSKASLSLKEKIALSVPLFKVKTITLQQPWASAVAQLGRNVENRTWVTRYRGPLLIHAGANLDLDGCRWIRKNFKIPLHDLPRSQVIAVADLVDCVEDSNSIWSKPGKYHWLLDNIRPCIDDSIGVKGKPFLWELFVPRWWADRYYIPRWWERH